MGVNEFQQDETQDRKLHRLSASVVRDQLKRLKTFKAKRKAASVDARLKSLRKSATDLSSGASVKITEQILSALEAKATLGEVADVFREVAGTYSGISRT